MVCSLSFYCAYVILAHITITAVNIMLQKIKLQNEEWEINFSSPIGKKGGFGQVFRGLGKSGDVAVKKLSINASQAAHREMEIGAELRKQSFQNIVPVLDYGQDANSDGYFLIMPVCDRSLQEYIDKQGTVGTTEAISVLLEILNGLEEVKDLTHRDLKPDNILFHEGRWKIADFGIAKFVEDSTSLETLRGFLTRAYAAPEQWLSERPTAATDIYALGCIAHALVTGSPPFNPQDGDFKKQHLEVSPPHLEMLPAPVSALVSQMLRKHQSARPARPRCISVLKSAGTTVTTGPLASLAKAVDTVAKQTAIEEAKRAAIYEARRKREQLFQEMKLVLVKIQQNMFDQIEKAAGTLCQIDLNSCKVRMGNGSLEIDTLNGIIFSGPPAASQDFRGQKSGWDIVGNMTVSLQQNFQERLYVRSADLILARPPGTEEYRWYEVSFWGFANNRNEPYSLNNVSELAKALGAASSHHLAHPVTPIDGEDEDSFIARWIELFSKAAEGRLAKPLSLPLGAL